MEDLSENFFENHRKSDRICVIVCVYLSLENNFLEVYHAYRTMENNGDRIADRKNDLCSIRAGGKYVMYHGILSGVADALNHAIKPDQSTVVLLETMAGKGSEVGRNFEELERIIELVDCEDKIGVCFDTCHTWDGGYDLVEDLDGVLHTFDQIIGLDRLKAVHLNDSMNVRDSHKDRHQKIGEGEIGAEALKRIVTHPLLAGRPFILETPNDDAGYAREIAMIKSWADESME